MAGADVKERLTRATRMESLRNNWENYWQDILYYCIARKAYITRTKEQGARLPVDVYDCFDKQTEVLTDKGWKFFDAVQYTDKALSLDPKSEVADYYPIDKIIVQDFKGNLKQFDNHVANFAITPNHKLLIRARSTKNTKCDWTIQKISDIKMKQFFLKRDFVWKGKEREYIEIKPLSKSHPNAKSYKFKMDDWLEFLGWFISEGFTYYNKQKGTFWISICQSEKSNTDKVSEIKQLLIRMGLSNKHYLGMNFKFGSKAIAEHLDIYAGKGAANKRIPEYVKTLSPRQIKILLNSYRKGDGYEKDNRKMYNTCSKFLADDVQELILKTGSYASITIRDNRGRKKFFKDHWIETKHLDYLISEYTDNRKSYDITINTNKIKDVLYEGKIYCVTVKPHHLIYVRRNGTCFWSGNSAAIEALRVFSSGLHGYLTNPASKWFNLRTENREKMDSKEVKVWLKDAEDKIYDTLNSTNFSQSILEAYIDFGSVGMCTIFVDDDPIDNVRFYTRPIKEIFIDQNEREDIDTVYRRFEFTVRQAYRKWGKNCSKSTIEKYDKKKYEEKVKLLHCVEPRFDYDPRKQDSINMPFMSVYIEVEAQKKLSEGGFKTFPYMIAGANKESGELYFTSPMMECFSDTKMVNQMTKTNLRAAMKSADPALDVPHDGYSSPLNLNPQAINYRNPGVPGVDDKIRVIPSAANIPITLELIDRVEKKIHRALFVDLFLALGRDDPQKTATEIMAREQERMLLLGPMVGRLNTMHGHGIKRTFAILLAKGIIKPIPDELADERNLVIDYVSPLARAQRGSELKSLQNAVTLIGLVAEGMPSITDKFDSDKYADEVGDLTGINPKLIRSEAEVKEIRKARATAEEAARKIQAADAVAGVAEKGTAAMKNVAEANSKGAA